MDIINSLPLELLVMIFNKLDMHWLIIISSVCVEWRKIAATFFKDKRSMYECANSLCVFLYKENKLECFDWAILNGFPWKKICSRVVLKNDFGFLKLSSILLCVDLSYLCAKATKVGRLGILKWLKSKGCSFDGMDLCFHAAERGQLDVIKWLGSEACKGSPDMWMIAKHRGNYNILAWGVKMKLTKDEPRILICGRRRKSISILMEDFLYQHKNDLSLTLCPLYRSIRQK